MQRGLNLIAHCARISTPHPPVARTAKLAPAFSSLPCCKENLLGLLNTINRGRDCHGAVEGDALASCLCRGARAIEGRSHAAAAAKARGAPPASGYCSWAVSVARKGNAPLRSSLRPPCTARILPATLLAARLHSGAVAVPFPLEAHISSVRFPFRQVVASKFLCIREDRRMRKQKIHRLSITLRSNVSRPPAD